MATPQPGQDQHNSLAFEEGIEKSKAIKSMLPASFSSSKFQGLSDSDLVEEVIKVTSKNLIGKHTYYYVDENQLPPYHSLHGTKDFTLDLPYLSTADNEDILKLCLETIDPTTNQPVPFSATEEPVQDGAWRVRLHPFLSAIPLCYIVARGWSEIWMVNIDGLLWRQSVNVVAIFKGQTDVTSGTPRSVIKVPNNSVQAAHWRTVNAMLTRSKTERTKLQESTHKKYNLQKRTYITLLEKLHKMVNKLNEDYASSHEQFLTQRHLEAVKDNLESQNIPEPEHWIDLRETLSQVIPTVKGMDITRFAEIFTWVKDFNKDKKMKVEMVVPEQALEKYDRYCMITGSDADIIPEKFMAFMAMLNFGFDEQLRVIEWDACTGLPHVVPAKLQDILAQWARDKAKAEQQQAQHRKYETPVKTQKKQENSSEEIKFTSASTSLKRERSASPSPSPIQREKPTQELGESGFETTLHTTKAAVVHRKDSYIENAKKRAETILKQRAAREIAKQKRREDRYVESIVDGVEGFSDQDSDDEGFKRPESKSAGIARRLGQCS